jgi:glycosyltransferase involved in cell wall biosynthesis
MPEPLTLLCAAKLAGNQLERHLEPLNRLDCVGKILLVRHEPAAARLDKVENVSFGSAGVPRDLYRMYSSVDALLKSRKVDWVLGFNPVPWGSVAGLAALRRGVPLSLSFIGMDFKQIQRPLARPLWSVVSRARLVTVTGERMRRGLVARGLAGERIRTLPHAVDTGRFAPGDAPPRYDVVSVGQLIPRKQMHVLIDAVAELGRRGRRVTLAILGEGPLKTELEEQARRLGVADRVTLLGYRNDVETVLRQARVFALVSKWEGVPFALIEAMCTGLVPIVTDVGTIADWILDGKNGHIVPVGDAGAVAGVFERLLDDHAHYGALRSAALAMREALSLEFAVEFWREALAT